MSDNITTQNQLVTVNASNESGAGGDESLLAEMLGGAGAQATRGDFCKDEEVKEWVVTNVANILQDVRNQYTPIHTEWQRINNMLSLEMEADASYKGETKVYLPTFAKAIETRTAHVCKASFPTDSFLDCVSDKIETPEESKVREGNKAWMKRQIAVNAKLRSNLKPFVRSTLSYGVGFLKVWWEDSLVKQKKSRYGAKSASLNSLLNSASKSQKYCGKLRVKALNNFTFYAYPLTVDSLDQCTLVFEDIQVSRQMIQTMVKHGYWNEEDITYNSAGFQSEQERQATLVKNTQTSQTALTGGSGGDLGEYAELTECWFSMHLPDKYFSDEEIANNDHLDPVPMKAVICGTNVIDIQYNPFNHGKHPYLMKKLMQNQDVLITPGYGKMVMTSQYLVNDLINQVNDNGIFGLNPMGLRDITKIAGHSLAQTMHPGAWFDVTDSGAIEFTRPPVEQLSYGTQLVQMAKADVNDVIAPPILQGSGGSGSGGAANTATGAQLLQANTKTDIQDFNEDMEEEVFQPLMDMAHSLGQQFESQEMYLAITGSEKIQFTPDMLAMDVSWRWVASSQTINQQMRGQQLGQFLQVILAPEVIQMLAARQAQLDIEPILRKMWEDGLGQRSFDSLLVKQPIVPTMPGQPMSLATPGLAGAGAQPLSPEQISPVSQANGNATPVEPVNGEGEQFRQVRQEGEDMSGLMGMLGNMPK